MGCERLGLMEFNLNDGRKMYVEVSLIDRVEDGAEGKAVVHLSDGEFFMVNGVAGAVAASVNDVIDGGDGCPDEGDECEDDDHVSGRDM
jgi:hypothetical protein